MTDGRVCLLCKSKDSDPDPTYTTRTLIWGYPCNMRTRRNVGQVCYYCMRTFNARFKAKYGSTTKLVEARLFSMPPAFLLEQFSCLSRRKLQDYSQGDFQDDIFAITCWL